MSSYIGIDFGACNIKAAKISSTGKAQKIKLNKNQVGGNFIPNVILYDEVKGNIEIKVGGGAKNSLDYENKVAQIKPKLTQKHWTKHIASLNREVTAVEVVKDIFSRVWHEITLKSSKAEEWDITITVPVSFSEVQKNLIRQAAVDAGIPLTTVVTEPFAALFSSEDLLDADEEKIILVFDFGGSTLDMSLFRIEGDGDELEITEMAAAGLKFGGIDIDNAILTKIFSVKYADEFKIFSDSDNGKNELLDFISRMKEEIFLNDDDEVVDNLTDKRGVLHEFTLTHDEISAAIDSTGVKAKIISLIDELLDDADIDKSDITAVKTFGGTSVIDYFQQLLKDYFSENVIDSDDSDPEEIYMGIALGAAKYREIVDNDDSNVIIKNVIPYSVGLANGGNFNRYIKRNEFSGFVTPYKPLLISALNKDNWRVAVYQSFSNEYSLPLSSEDVIFMGDVELDKTLYTATDAILFKMKTDGAGQIHMKFYEQRDDSDAPVLVEEKILRIGG